MIRTAITSPKEMNNLLLKNGVIKSFAEYLILTKECISGRFEI